MKPTLVTALRIAHALGTPVNQLFYLEGIDADAAPVRPPVPAHSAAVRARPGPERALPARALADQDAQGTSRG